MQRKLQGAAWILIVVLGLYIFYRGLAIVRENHLLQKLPGIGSLGRSLETMAVKTHMPSLTFAWQGTGYGGEWTDFVLDGVFPLYSYAKEEAEGMPDIESRLEYELMMELESPTEELAEGKGSPEKSGAKTDGTSGGERPGGSRAEEAKEGPGGSKAEEAKEGPGGSKAEEAKEGAGGSRTEKTQDGKKDAETGKSTEKGKDPSRPPIAPCDEDQLRDYNYLLNHYFAVDPSTTPLESQLNYDAFMAKDLRMSAGADKPQILIYHTHSQEAFIDSREGRVEDTIVGVGDRLTEILTNAYGYNVIHHTKTYDLVDGVLDRNMAYTLAAPEIQQILDENPSIEVVIDLHRDGVDGHKFVTEVDGKPVSQIMFYNGLSRSAENGEIDYLPNPYLSDNLAFSFQLQKKANEYYPGWTRAIYLSSLRYNLHMRPKSLLIESGTQLNTVEEEMNSMELLADILNQVLREKRDM